MMKFTVIGDPIEHSLSPAMQNAGIQAMGLDAEYSKTDVKSDELANFAEFARKELDGFNITIPHKKNIIPYLDEIDEFANFAESVNTVAVKNGRLCGTSTDGYGLETAVKEEFAFDIEGKNIFFVGCGGAVRAVAFYFASKNVKSMIFANRTIKKAENLVEDLKKFRENIELKAVSIDNIERERIRNSDIVIQGTSLGLKADDPSPLPHKLFFSELCYYDTIYKNTEFLKSAKFANAKFADGRGMLLHQGIKSLSIWTNQNPPTEIMREALNKAIQNK